MDTSTSFLMSFGICTSTSIYVLLTFMAIISTFSPCLSRLAAHGKTRTSIIRPVLKNECLVSSSSSSSSGSTIISKLKFFLDHPCLQIHKKHFTTFYSFGLLWSVIILSSYVVAPQQQQSAVFYLLYLHLSRRYLECRFVHVWNGTMHLAGYALGLIHYFLLPFIFLSNNVHHRPRECSTRRFAVGILLNLVAQYYQHVHHTILASYRNRSTRFEQKNQTNPYSIPSGFWFEYISCPHYLAEILVYLSFAILLHPTMITSSENDLQQKDITTSTTCILTFQESMMSHVMNQVCCKVSPWRHVILTIWVFVNLAISARDSHTWYKRTFPSYPKHIKALLPWIW